MDEELFSYVLETCQSGIQELGMTQDDLDFVVCTPDEVNYPEQRENTVAWGFIFRYRFKNGRWATKKLVLFSDTCPVNHFMNFYDHILEEAKRLARG